MTLNLDRIAERIGEWATASVRENAEVIAKALADNPECKVGISAKITEEAIEFRFSVGVPSHRSAPVTERLDDPNQGKLGMEEE